MTIALPFTRLEQVGDIGRNSTQSAVVERFVTFDSGAVSVRQLDYPRPSSCIWSCDKYLISYSLSRRRNAVWATYLDMPAMARQPVGGTMLIPARRTVQTGGPEGRERSLMCLIGDELFESILPDGLGWNEATLMEGLRLNGADVQWLLLKIYQEIREEQFCSALVIESLVTALAVAMVRQLGLAAGERPTRSGGIAPWKLRRIRDRVAADLPPPSVSELALVAEMSVRHLTRGFKAETGVTVAQYVQQAVIERARELLAEGKAPIADIAKTLGFASSAGFSSAFRKATGFRPSDIARRSR